MVSFMSMERRQELLAQARQDAEVLRQNADAANRDRLMQPEVLRVLKKYYGLLVPVEYGGLGVDSVTYGLVLAELAKGDPSPALWLAMHGFAMSEAGRPEVSDEARRRVFEMGLRVPFSAAVSEVQSTGHLPQTFIPQNVTARQLADGGYVLNGVKKVVTGYFQSDHLMVFANLEGSEATTVCLIVPVGHPGMDEGEEWNSVGFMKSTRSNSVSFTNVKVGSEALVFTTDNFLTDAVVVYGVRTFGYMAAYLGIFERLFELAVGLLKKRIPLGMTQSLSFDPLVATAIGTCHRKVTSARLLLTESLAAFDAKDPAAALCMLHAKAAIGELVEEGVPMLIRQIGLGGLSNPEVKRCLDDITVGSLMAPTSQMCALYGGCMVMGQDPAEIPSIR